MKWLKDEVKFHTDIMLYWQFKNPELAHKIDETIRLLKDIYGAKEYIRQDKDQAGTIKWS